MKKTTIASIITIICLLGIVGTAFAISSNNNKVIQNKDTTVTLTVTMSQEDYISMRDFYAQKYGYQPQVISGQTQLVIKGVPQYSIEQNTDEVTGGKVINKIPIMTNTYAPNPESVDEFFQRMIATTIANEYQQKIDADEETTIQAQAEAYKETLREQSTKKKVQIT